MRITRFLLPIIAALAIPASAQASAGPTYQYCHHHRCTPSRRAYRIKCDGTMWLSPKPVHRHLLPWQCSEIPSFPWNRSIPLLNS